MKQYTTPQIKISFANLEMSNVQHIDFVIKQDMKRDEPPVVWRQYDASSSVIIPEGHKAEYNSEGGFFTIRLTADESSHIDFDEKGRPTICWLDTRVKRKDGTIPNTPMKKIRITPTLFSENYEEGGEM